MTTFDKIRQWADDRGLIENSTPKAQMTKLWEEYDELQAAIRAMDIDEIKDAIGDCMVVLTVISAQIGFRPLGASANNFPLARELEVLAGRILSDAYYSAICHSIKLVSGGLKKSAERFGLSIEDCIYHAYDQIKDRKGHMNEAGVFVKEEA